MSKRIILTAVLSLLAIPSPAQAQRAAPIAGAGAIKCGKYLDVRKNAAELNDVEFAAWAWGYISAYNVFSSAKQVRYDSIQTVLAFLDKHCRDHPLDYVSNGVDALIAARGGRPLGEKAR